VGYNFRRFPVRAQSITLLFTAPSGYSSGPVVHFAHYKAPMGHTSPVADTHTTSHHSVVPSSALTSMSLARHDCDIGDNHAEISRFQYRDAGWLFRRCAG